jgi:hypothetical protein
MESAEDRKRELLAQLAVQFGGTLASTPGSFAEGLGAGARSISQPLMAGLSDIRKDRMARLAAERAEKGKVFEGVLGMRGKAAESAAAEARAKADRESREEIERANRESREAIASLPDNKERAAQVIFDEAKAAGMPITMEQAMARATAALNPAPDRYNALSNRLVAANKEIAALQGIMELKLLNEKNPKKVKELKDAFDNERQKILRNYYLSEANLKELNDPGNSLLGAPMGGTRSMGSTRSMGGAPAGSTPPPPPGFTLNPPYSPQ